jgi:hypothetical protein
MNRVLAVGALALAFCFFGTTALAAVAIPARYQLRGHLPDLGERPALRFFLTDLAYEKFRTDLGDANVFPPSSSLFMSFDKDALVLYTRGNDPAGGRCIATSLSAGVSTDVTIGLAWQSGTCGAPLSAHYPFILLSLSRTASDGTSWVQANRSICAQVETSDTNACASLGGGASATPAPTAPPASAAPTATGVSTTTAAPSATPTPTPTRSVTPTAAPTATGVAVSSPTPSAVPSRSPLAAASPTAAADSSPNAVDLWLGAALVGLGVMLGIALMAMRRPREPSGFRRR